MHSQIQQQQLMETLAEHQLSSQQETIFVDQKRIFYIVITMSWTGTVQFCMTP
jgi:tRNA A22 N-methylase